jgi:conjugal transfer ATP-binding protein TraC
MDIFNSIVSIFKNTPQGEGQTDEEIKLQGVKDWLPVIDVRDGIVHMKDEQFVKIIEIIPINFKLKSRYERRMLMINYRALLKACKFPMQISVQCRKANVEPHINRMEKFLSLEKNENVRNMLEGYISLIKQIGNKGAITRRYFMVIPYVNALKSKTVDYTEVLKQLYEKSVVIKEFMKRCGNEAIIRNDTEFTVDILYSYLNKKTCEVQKIGSKLMSLTGMFLDVTTESEED